MSSSALGGGSVTSTADPGPRIGSESDAIYLKQMGSTLRNVLNDLKRNEEVAAAELGIDITTLNEILAGRRELPWTIIQRAARIWPINERDLLPLHDDAPDGLLIMSEEQSRQTSREISRGGYSYYEYRDTAMSRVASLRPEWIRMLHVVDDTDPENETIQWNNGHFLFQFTYFVGEVNYYYDWDGKRFCAPMSTGDSVFGVPFARHSFASRDQDQLGLILALTYGGRLFGSAQHELAILGDGAALGYVMPEAERAQRGALLRFHMDCSGFSSEYLSRVTGVDKGRIEAMMSGQEEPTPSELMSICRILRVSARDLSPVTPDTIHGVVIAKAGEAGQWQVPSSRDPSYRATELAGSRTMPFSRSLELEVLKGQGSSDTFQLQVPLHQYIFSLGPSPVIVRWKHRGEHNAATVSPGDSIYVKPFVPHLFELASRAPSAEPTKLLVLRVAATLAGDEILEASLIGADSIGRVVSDDRRWYGSPEHPSPRSPTTQHRPS